MQQEKSFFTLATAIAAMLVATSVTPGLARQAKNPTYNSGYQLQSAASSYAYEPQAISMASRRGQCWIVTDASRPYGYMDSCANPLAYDPTLDPIYYGGLHGE